jgi:hypothetical protein
MVLGVPLATFIANASSIQIAMSFFAIVNILAFIVTFLFVPTMPVPERRSYGSQLSVLKRPILWVSIVAVICLTVTHVFGKVLSVMFGYFWCGHHSGKYRGRESTYQKCDKISGYLSIGLWRVIHFSIFTREIHCTDVCICFALGFIIRCWQ